MSYTFKDLYKFSEDFIEEKCSTADCEEIFVPVPRLARELARHIDWLRRVDFYPIQDTTRDDKVWGMYERIADQDAAYEVENSEIVTIAHGGWQNRCYKRFVCTKELLHVFDHSSERVSSEPQYGLLTNEIEDIQEVETRPSKLSPQMLSEIRAQWRAMLILCPKGERDKIVADVGGNEHAWAYKYAIPQGLIETIKSPAYDRAYDDIILN